MGRGEAPAAGAMEDRAWQTLQAVGAADAVLLLLPLFVLTGGAAKPGEAFVSRSCGWTPASLSTCCLVAICCLCFSLILIAAQLVAIGVVCTGAVPPLGAGGARQQTAFARRVLRDLPLPLLVTAVGAALGASSLWGQAALSSGECNATSPVLVLGSFAAAYVFAGYYMALSRRLFCGLGDCAPVGPEPEPPLLSVGVTPDSSSCLVVSDGNGDGYARCGALFGEAVNVEVQVPGVNAAEPLVPEQSAACSPCVTAFKAPEGPLSPTPGRHLISAADQDPVPGLGLGAPAAAGDDEVHGLSPWDVARHKETAVPKKGAAAAAEPPAAKSSPPTAQGQAKAKAKAPSALKVLAAPKAPVPSPRLSVSSTMPEAAPQAVQRLFGEEVPETVREPSKASSRSSCLAKSGNKKNLGRAVTMPCMDSAMEVDAQACASGSTSLPTSPRGARFSKAKSMSLKDDGSRRSLGLPVVESAPEFSPRMSLVEPAMGEEEPRSLMIPSLNSYAVSVTVPGSPEEDIPLADQLLEGIHIPPPPAPYGSGKSPSRRGSMEGGSMARGSSESVMSAGSLFSTGSGESKRDWKPEFKVVIKRSSTGVLDERPKNESRGAFKRASTGQQSRRRSSQGRGSLKRRSMPMQEAVSRRGSLVGMTMDGRRASGGVLAVPATPSIQAQDVKVSKKESRWESQFAMRRSTLLEAARFLDAAGPLQDALTSSQATQELQRAVGSKAPTGEAILGSQESPKSPKSPKLGMGLLPDFDGDAAKPGRAGSAAESRRSSLASSGDSEIVPSPRSSADKKTLGAAAAADGGEKPGAEAAADGGGKQPRYSILLTRQATQKMANNRKSVSIKVPSALKLAEEADDDGDDACRTPDELEELESEEDGSPRGKAKNKRASDLAMLDMQVLHYDQSPINFSLMGSLPKEGTEDTSDSNSDDDEGDGSELEDEYWSQSEDQQVEVPVWLLEKMKRQEAQKEQEESRRPSTPPVGLPKFEEDEDAEDSDMVGELPAAPQPKAAPPQGSKRISFHDQVTGTSFERYSILKNQGEKAPSKTVQLAVRSASDGACFATSASPFWKIPMPTRKNTMMTAPTYSAETDEEDDESEKASSSTGLVPPHKVLRQPPAPKFKPPQKELKQPAGKEDNRRPSVLGVFSNDGAKAAGLYALPASSEEKSELVEVKRRSIVMSTNMLHDILKAKVDDERFDTIQEDFDKVDAEVVLPFFSAVKGAFRQCHCQTDPETGFVIHTCMTPAATQCENTQAFQSFVCSAWSSRRGSRKQSEAASRARSRRGSCEEDEDGEGSEEDDTIGPLPSGHERPSHPALLSTPGSGPPAPNKNKRIRNASMLAIVGAAGPAPQKQNTDATLSQHEKEKKKQQKGGQSDDSDSSDEGMPEENELNVSFKNIQPTEQESPDGALSPEGMGSDPSMPKPDSASVPQTDKKALDQQVESDLGHRFELVEPWQLAALLKNREQREHILTVDVRGRDWVGGHIPLSINLHTSEVLRHPESLINQCLRNKIHHLVFTCMYSVLRARKSALAVEQAQMEAQKSGLQTYRIRISLLAGGMHAWVNHFVRVSPQKALVQDFDAECWSDGGPSQGGLVHVMDALWSSGGQKALSDALTAELSALMHARGCSSRDGSRRASNNDITTEVN